MDTVTVINILLLLVITTKCHQPLRVYQGTEDVDNIFPFAVVLETKFLLYGLTFRRCTGSLIAEQWVLAAGHCLTSDLFLIRYGEVDASDDAPNTFSKVLKKYRHPGFTIFRKFNKLACRNDIGLLLVEKISSKAIVRISSVDYKAMLGGSVKMGGFGWTGYVTKKGNIGPHFVAGDEDVTLRVAEGVVIKCSGSEFPMKIEGPMICVAHKCAKKQWVSVADSGAPLVYAGKIVGVCSLGDPPYLGYFTPVSPYLEWIASVIDSP